MEAKAKQTNIKMTARKLRRVINEVRGKGVIEAQDLLRFMPYFAARVVEKNLKVAVANAKEQFDVNPEQLKISEIFKLSAPTPYFSCAFATAAFKFFSTTLAAK